MFAQTLSTPSPTLSVIIIPFPTVLCCSICIACCWYNCRTTDTRYSRFTNQASTNPTLQQYTPRVIYDVNQSSQKGVVTPSRGNTSSCAPPHAATPGRPLIPQGIPVIAPQREISEYNAEAPPPYSSLPPPYNINSLPTIRNSLRKQNPVLKYNA